MTPGFGALSQTRLLRNLLIKADLPTLGKPMTAALTGRGWSPLALRLSLMLLLSDSAAFVTCIPACRLDEGGVCPGLSDSYIGDVR